MQRREIDELAQLMLDRAVDQDRLAEPLAAVDDPVPDRVGITQPGFQRRLERPRFDNRPWRVELLLGQRSIAVAQQRQLDAAGPGVHDEDPHG